MDDTLIPRIPLFAGATTPAHLLAFHARCFRASCTRSRTSESGCGAAFVERSST